MTYNKMPFTKDFIIVGGGIAGLYCAYKINQVHPNQTILLIEHNLAEVRRICTRLVVLDNGRKLAEGSPDDVLKESSVLEAYIGQGNNHAEN